MEWISVKDRLPIYAYAEKMYSKYVFVTDGKLVEIGQYIYRPRSYGCAVDDAGSKATCGPQPHWHLETDYTSFIDGNKCFGHIEIFEITHWMPLPHPPNENSL